MKVWIGTPRRRPAVWVFQSSDGLRNSTGAICSGRTDAGQNTYALVIPVAEGA